MPNEQNRSQLNRIPETVRRCYWEDESNCAVTTLTCLSELFSVDVSPQVFDAAIGMHGAGGFRAQCGLVEGTLMFLGLYLSSLGWSREQTAQACCTYAEAFTRRFSSLSCRDLRPGGFNDDDPPHLCTELTEQSVVFSRDFIGELVSKEQYAQKRP
jgi:hypothetical protein